jgi:PhnB protein
MKLYPHVNFAGQCEAAFRFYESCLDGKIVTMLTWGESPMASQVPAEWHNKICHATLTAGTSELAGSDSDAGAERPTGFQILLEIEDAGEAERVFQALSENGCVKMAMQKTFWALRFGVLVDQFGIAWEINCANQ